MIPAGSSLTFTVDGSVTLGWWDPAISPEQVRGDAINSMRARLTVESVTLSPTSRVYVGVLNWSYQAIVQVKTKVAHAQAEDIGSIIAHAFYEASNIMPTVQLSSEVASATPGGIGAAGGNVPGGITQPGGAGLFGDFEKTVKDFFGGVQSTVVLVAIGAIVVGIAVLKDD